VGAADASFGAAGRAKDQPVVRLDHVDDALEPGLDVQDEAVALDDLVVRLGAIGELEANASVAANDADAGLGVEPTRRGVRAREDVRRPLRELDHPSMVPAAVTGAIGPSPPQPADLPPTPIRARAATRVVPELRGPHPREAGVDHAAVLHRLTSPS